ncbi:MAG: YggS family pyridoxal phosphate-dependent enzyme [Bacteroidota bacterium]
MKHISENFKEIKNNIPSHVKLVAVSKTKPNDHIMEVYNCGHKIFGESKAQELVPKHEELPKDIKWHMIGHLQSNKVKYIAPFVDCIHSIDSFKILKTINKEAKKNDRIIDGLLQMHIAEEETKFGLSLKEAEEILQSDAFQEMQNIRITGLMCMATFTKDEKQIRKEFKLLHHYFDFIKEKYFNEKDFFRERSMGMSNDYHIAIEEGSTMIRVGSIIFGKRNYT